jgi:hypothetical protein
MDLMLVVQGLAWVAVVITCGIALACVPDPEVGMRRLTHRLEQLPQVMLGRYIAFAGFTLFVALLGDLRVMAAWALTMAFMAFADSFIYARLGKPYVKHLSAGLAASVMLAVVLAALISNGAA